MTHNHCCSTRVTASCRVRVAARCSRWTSRRAKRTRILGLNANCRALPFSRGPRHVATKTGLNVDGRPQLRDEARGTPAEERLDSLSLNSKTFLLHERQRGLSEEHLRTTNCLLIRAQASMSSTAARRLFLWSNSAYHVVKACRVRR